MEQQNELLKQTLIKHYSKLMKTSEAQLTERVKDTDWWKKEQVYVIKQRERTGIFFIIVVVCVFLSVASGLFVLSTNPTMLSTSFFALLAVFFSLFAVLIIHSRNEERKKLFEIMQLAFLQTHQLPSIPTTI